MDYYGKRLATCSSDRSIKIFKIQNQEQTLLTTLSGYFNINKTRRSSLAGSMGPSKIWKLIGILFLRFKSVHLEGSRWSMDKNKRTFNT